MTPEEQRGQAWLDQTRAEYEQIADGTTLAFYQKGKIGELLDERDTQAKQVSDFETAWQLESDNSCVLERDCDLLRKAMLEGWSLGTDMEGEHCEKWYFINDHSNELLMTDAFDTPEQALAALVEKLKGEDDDA